MKSLSLYLHIPFCYRKCKYCDFLSAPANGRVQEDYLNALKKELTKEAEKFRDRTVETVYIGGGTPTAVDADKLTEVLNALKQSYHLAKDAEFSMEANPGTVTGKALEQYKNAGINRLSIGLQSARDEELKRLGRIHTFDDFVKTYQTAREAGFANINVDLMAALPGQSVEDYRYSLEKVLEFAPEHISAYSLIIEENTEFYDKYGAEADRIKKTGKGLGLLPDEDTEREMVSLTHTMLQSTGYNHYEISNYAKEGFACKHNLVYWRRGEYVGFGLGAASLFAGVHSANTRDLTQYIKNPQAGKDITKLTTEDAMAEFMFLGLRTYEGVSPAEFYKAFGITLQERYGDVLLQNQKDGLLLCGENIRLTEKGFDVANYVMAQFLPE